MRLEALTVALRPRSPWEAVELGTALVRRHAAAIWRPWLWLTLPVLVLLNLLAWSIDALWLAALVMWWLKPLFDRVPLYVLSRAVFGEVPSTAQTLRAQGNWGARWLPAYLGWRRLGPARSLLMPVDLLEGEHGGHARARRRALGGSVYGVGALLTIVCVNFEIALQLGAIAGAVLFIPNEYLPDAARGFTDVLREQPLWLQLALNAVAWLATTLVEPFYIGAGFGLYLNRRTEIEAWDIELVLRRLRARLLAAAVPLAAVGLVLSALLMPLPGRAQALVPAPAPAAEQDAATEMENPAKRAPVADAGSDEAKRLEQLFVPLADDRSLRKAVARAYAGPTLSPKRKITRWLPRDAKPKPKPKPRENEPPAWLAGLGSAFGIVGEFGLWIVFGGLALLLLLTVRYWGPWLRGGAALLRREPAEPRHEPRPAEEPLPDDIATAVRKLWHEGHPRQALALLYRASVESMAQRANVVLVPGATEAQCLRASRQLPLADDRDLFARAVRTWQYAAYAGRLPTGADFDDLLIALTQRFGWAR